MTGFLVGAIYILSGNLSVSGFRFSFSNRTRNHLVILAVLFLLVRAASYLIDISELLLSPGGAMFGAGYTDVYVRLLALRVSMIVAVLLALALIIRWRYQRKLIVGLLGAWIISGLLLGGIVPTLVQNWIVEPNEFEREREFLQYHIEMTERHMVWTNS